MRGIENVINRYNNVYSHDRELTNTTIRKSMFELKKGDILDEF